MSDSTSDSSFPFTFTASGYEDPDFSSVSTREEMNSQIADIRSAINVLQLYQNETYSYVKSCRTIVVGYTEVGIQTLKLPCEYGGIRDIGGYVYGDLKHGDIDLSAYIHPKEFLDIVSYIIGPESSYKNIPSYINVFNSDQNNLLSAVKSIYKEDKDLNQQIGGYLGVGIDRGLSSYLYSIEPIDLQGIVNVIEIRNLAASITGEWWHGKTSLGSQVPTISLRNYTEIISFLHGWQEKDLESVIRPFDSKDLITAINGGYFKLPRDLYSYLSAVEPVELLTSIHGWDTKSLTSKLVSGYGPGDLPSYIFAVLPFDLKSKIKVFKELEVERSLRSIIEGYYIINLVSNINPVVPKDLGSYINSAGKSITLNSSIIPMTIVMSTVFNVSLLSSRDLNSMINYGCQRSDYRDLASYTYAFMKKDLRSRLIGWYGDYADNLRDLKSYINVETCIAENMLDVNFNVAPIYTQLNINFSSPENLYKTANDLIVVYSDKEYVELNSHIYCYPRNRDLPAYINAQIQADFTTTPEWVKPKTTEVFINLDRFEERWTRFVDLMFNSGITGENYYFYVSGEEKIYKINKNQQWVLWVTGYDHDYNNMIERANIRRKYIFNLSNYDTMDQAIRSMMDRVVKYRQRDLRTQIFGEIGLHKDLKSNIYSVFKYRWVKNLKTAIAATTTSYVGVDSSITPELFKSQTELSSLIEGKGYEPPQGDDINFVFEDEGYTSSEDYNNMNWTYEQI